MIQLTPRERWLAITGGSGLLLAVMYGFLLKPVLARTETLYRILPEKQRDLSILQQEGQQYVQLQEQIDAAHQAYQDTEAGTALFPALEALLVRHNLKQAATLNPSPPFTEGRYQVTPIALELADVQLTPLLALLEDLQHHQPPLHVADLHLSHNPDHSAGLHASITLHSLMLAVN